MIPLFKSHYSIGKSILTFEEDSERSIVSLARDAALEEVVVVEDSLIGFLEARKAVENQGLDLRFGLRVSVSNNPTQTEECEHKIIIFAKDSIGCKKLNQIYSNAFVKGGGVLDEQFLKEVWEDKHLKLAIPFYDSFIFNNTMNFSTCTPDFSYADPTFFIEDNGLPFDDLIGHEVDLYCDKNCHDIVETKSIFYKNKDDFSAYQAYKCICNRGFRARTLEAPNFDHQGSDQFCFESWRQAVAT
jgi:DNA polymerase III alpha subunit